MPGRPSFGHLGSRVSELIDGRLDASAAQRAWTHLRCCSACLESLQREVWVKDRLAAMTSTWPSPDLSGALSGLPSWEPSWEMTRETAGEPDRRRARRTAMVLAGAGWVSAALLGLGALALEGAAPAGGGASVDGPPPAPPAVRPVGTFLPASDGTGP